MSTPDEYSVAYWNAHSDPLNPAAWGRMADAAAAKDDRRSEYAATCCRMIALRRVNPLSDASQEEIAALLERFDSDRAEQEIREGWVDGPESIVDPAPVLEDPAPDMARWDI